VKILIINFGGRLMKKVLCTLMSITVIAGSLMGCGAKTESASGGFDTSKAITVVSREDGSGTRGAFIELFGVQVKDASGNKTDKTTDQAVIANQTDVMLTNISGDDYAIGYVSLGSLNDSVKALKIDGIEATIKNIKDGSYKISRPFNIVTKSAGSPSEVTQDFMNYILSSEGQAIVNENKYIKVDESAKSYSGKKPSGKVVVAGSSSVTPVMEKLKEAYLAINPNAKIEVQQSDSGTGIQAATNGTCDIGMSSRELTESELKNLKPTKIAIDGIAVIENKKNTTDTLTKEDVKSIFTGEVTKWSLK